METVARRMSSPTDRTITRIIAGFAVLAAGITLYQLTRPGYLFGITPDISAWLGGSIRLVHGALPYRDFDLVQPPGFTLLATPFAVLSEWIGSRDALAVLRLCTPLLAAGSVLLIGRVIRHKGPAAVVVACAVMALYPAEVYAIRSGLLEPVVDLFCLAGAAFVFEAGSIAGSRTRLLLGGAAFGVAALVKIPGITPALVLAVLCLPELRRRMLPFVAGVVGGFLLPTLPFFLMAPGAFIRDVASPLASIPAAHRIPILARLTAMTGTRAIGGGDRAAVIVTAAIVAMVIAAFVFPRRRPSMLEWFAIATTALVALAQFGPSYYFTNYAAFMAPFLGLLLGITLVRLLDVRAPRIALVIAATGATVLCIGQVIAVQREFAPDINRIVDAIVPAGACTLSDAPSKLVTTNRFEAARPGCATMIDPEGATQAYGYGSAGAQRLWTVQVEHADYIVTSTPFDKWYIPPGGALRAYVADNFRLVRSGVLLFYIRNGFPSGGAPG